MDSFSLSTSATFLSILFFSSFLSFSLFFLLTTSLPPLLFLRFNFIFFNALASFLSLRRRERKRNPLYRVSYIRKSYPEACLALEDRKKKKETKPSLWLFSLPDDEQIKMHPLVRLLKAYPYFLFSSFFTEKLWFLRIIHRDTKTF